MQRFPPGNLGFNKVSVASNRLDSPRSTLIHPRFPPDSPSADHRFPSCLEILVYNVNHNFLIWGVDRQ